MRLLDFMKEKKQKLFGFAQIDFIDEGFRQFSPHVTEQFHTQPVQQLPYEPTLTDQTSYVARIVPDTILSDRCEKFARQPRSVASTAFNKLKYARGGSKRRKVGVSDLNEPLPVENLEHLAVVALSVWFHAIR
ncbi:hypothetical protein Tco_0769773 [Tanacetum coccineum]|uniref:Uncharacterized protein n=1 Tax=Tanacetum coccineum TaxID=301880 RepID=A0ABQ4ZB97_9ASTR